jgi:hypothetical protein
LDPVSRALAIVVLCIAAALLALVWRTLPSAAPPLYDGLCLADRYRILGTNPGPTSSAHPFGTGTFPAAEVFTSENPAQAQLLMQDGTFASSSPFTVRISPVPRPGPPLPSGRTIDGNVYVMSATTSGGATVNPLQPLTVVLRATQSSGPMRVIERLDGQTWTPLQTFPAGCGDTLEATSTRLGDFAVVKISTATPSTGAPLGLMVGAIVGVIAVAVIVLTAVLLRRGRPSGPRR